MKCNLPHSRPVEIKMMTPMIDIIFLLLVFFVCTANFAPPEEILPMDATLPGSAPAEMMLPDPVDIDVVLIQISFEREPYWLINEANHCSTLYEVRNVLRLLCDLRADIPVIIASADNVPTENVIDVYDVCRLTGLSRIQFAVE